MLAPARGDTGSTTSTTPSSSVELMEGPPGPARMPESPGALSSSSPYSFASEAVEGGEESAVERFFVDFFAGIEALQQPEFDRLFSPEFQGNGAVQTGGEFLLAIQPVLPRLAPLLDARSFQSLRETCTTMFCNTVSLVPGMPLTLLKKHQRRSLEWMTNRERAATGPFDNDWLFDSQFGAASPVKSVVPPPSHHLSPSTPTPSLEGNGLLFNKKTRGGMLCDEPGTGKTATALALCARTKGLVPSPPPPLASAPGAKGKRPTPSRQDLEERARRLWALPCVPVTLVVVPITLTLQWSAMVDKHAPVLTKTVVDTPNDLPDLLSLAETGRGPDLVIVPSTLVSAAGAARLGVEQEVDNWFQRYRFLRLIVDEGHSMANHSQVRWLLEKVSRERTWLVTGTPSKKTSVSEALNRLREVLMFLGALAPVDEHWRRLVAIPLRNNPPGSPVREQAMRRLERVFSLFMLRHSTAGIFDFPVQRIETHVRLSKHDVENFNILASVVRLNTVLIQINDVGRHQSIRADMKLAKRTLFNLSWALGHMWQDEGFILTVSAKALAETRELFAVEPFEARMRMEAFIKRSERGEKATCPLCRRSFVVLLIFGCGHHVCPFCFDPEAPVTCPTCQTDFDGNAFAWLQPGLVLERRLSPSATLEGTTVFDGIHAKSLIAHGQTFLAKVGCKARHICQRITECCAADDAWKCIVFSQDREVADHVGDAIARVLGVDAVASMSGRKRRAQEQDLFLKDTVTEWKCNECGKVIVDVTKTRCDEAYVKVLDQGTHRTVNVLQVAPGNAKLGDTVRILALHRDALVLSPARRCKGVRTAQNTIQRRVKCRVLLLSFDASHGLDLSIVRHVFLVDPIDDKALEQQIIARAARLGAVKVTVESVLADKSVEVQGPGARSVGVLDRLRLMSPEGEPAVNLESAAPPPPSPPPPLRRPSDGAAAAAATPSEPMSMES